MNDYTAATGQQVKPETTACHTCGPPTQNKRRWEDNRHAKLVDQAIELVKTGSPKEDVAELNRWLGMGGFMGRLLAGLHDADYKFPYDSFVYSRHFYDPDTEKSYWGNTDFTAKTQVLRHFNVSFAKRYETPDAIGDIAYELGLALHYLTDLSQPMHAANFTNNPLIGDWRHRGLEMYAEQNLNDFHAESYKDVMDIDKELAKIESIEQLVKNLAWHSKKIFQADVEPLAEKMVFFEKGMVSFTSLWNSPENKDRTHQIFRQAMPAGERAAAALILLWVRGYESILNRIYERFLLVRPSQVARKGDTRDLVNGTRTVRSLIRYLASGGAHIKVVWERAAQRKTTPRNVLFDNIFNRLPQPTERPTDDDMVRLYDQLDKWSEEVKKMVDSEEYGRRFGDHLIPGYAGLSGIKR